MNKKGISLIVLVITIIVMIIIAGAIILSLSSSNVTARANLSTLLSDRANYQSALATKIAENVNNDGSVDYTTVAAEMTTLLNSASKAYGSWSLDSTTQPSKVLFKIDATVDTEKTYGLNSTGIAKYDWLSKGN